MLHQKIYNIPTLNVNELIDLYLVYKQASAKKNSIDSILMSAAAEESRGAEE